MPFDQKRINGPENSFSYKLYVQEKEKDEEAMETDNQKSRSDQRSNEEIRRIGLQMSVISKAKGSCYIELGETKVIVGVFELREIPRQNKYA
jgi:exosome complex component MTR3